MRHTMWTVALPTPDDTMRLGEALGRRAFPGAVVVLTGDLGAGKTVFARGVGRGLGVTSRVQSPTFAIVQQHEGGRLPFWHCDLYRVGAADELAHVGLPEVLDAGGLVLIEWGERFADALPADRLEIRLEDEGEGRRAMVVATGPRHLGLERLA